MPLQNRPTFIAAIAALILFWSASVNANDAHEWCEGKVDELSKQFSNSDQLIEAVTGLEDTCEGTGVYEYNLSKLYIASKDYEQAAAFSRKGLKYDSPYKELLELNEGDILLHQKKYGAARPICEQVAKKYPSWYLGYSRLGFVLFAQGQTQASIDHLKRANSITETADAYRTLTLAYYMVESYEKSIESLNRAYSLDNSIVADRDPMIAGIRSYAELGKYDLARDFLALLLNQRPDLESDEQYLKAGFYLRQKLIEAGLVVEQFEAPQ